MQQDAYRLRQLQDLGWQIVRVTAADIHTRPESIAWSVLAALLRARK